MKVLTPARRRSSVGNVKCVAETDSLMANVAILLSDGCQSSAVSTIIEALSVGNLQSSQATSNGADVPFRWRTVSFDGKPVRTMGDMTITADGAFEDLGEPDLIFLPALKCDDQNQLFKRVERLIAQWGGTLKHHHERNGYIAASCSAAFVLAELGLLDGRKATTSWFLARSFRARYPQVSLVRDVLVVKDGRVLTSAAFSACLNLGLEIVAEFAGARAVLPCARVMLVDVSRTAQLSYANLSSKSAHGDDLVVRAQTLLLTNLSRGMSLETLADHLKVTPRTLRRRFKRATGETPLTFLQNARIERSKAG
jgi:transcriptional regulator GlxA family with amidase domain